MRVVDRNLIASLKQKAEKSPRKRAHYIFHNYEDAVQRMVNVMLKDTYVRPHKHKTPDKVEHFVILEGKVLCLIFDEQGKVVDNSLLTSDGDVVAVDILPDTYHSFICLSEYAVLMEFIEGPYDPKTHKKLALFAPEENSAETMNYMRELCSLVEEEM